MAKRVRRRSLNATETSRNNEMTENNEAETNEAKISEDLTIAFKWTPLQVAASRGQQELLMRLVNMNPELVDALDSQKRSLLHLASANGHIEIVRVLTRVRPEMCLARDQDGANPLHIAAMKGKIGVLYELFQANPYAARARVESGERDTILHLCVKYDQIKFLKTLLENHFKGEEFVNAKDNAGNTILHLAVAGRRSQIIDYVLNHTEIDVDATNASKQTALDILCLGRRKGTKPEGVDKNIQDLLKNHNAELIANNHVEIADDKDQLIVAAVLLATLAFQAAVTPPGGVWQDDSDGHKSGKAVMASNYPLLYAFFIFFNTAGFISSLVTLALLMIDWPFKPGSYLMWMYITKITTIISIAQTYFVSLIMVSPLNKQNQGSTTMNHLGVIVLMLASLFVFYLIMILTASRKSVVRVMRRWKACV